MVERNGKESHQQKHEKRFHQMADVAPAMLWVTDLTGVCTFLSQGWYQYTGQTEATGLVYGWINAVHPDDQKHSRQIFLDANANHLPFRLDYRLRRHDGEYRWAIDAGQPYFSETGEFMGYVGSVIDIHERKMAEKALRESEEKYRTFFNSIDEGFCICEMLLDKNGNPYDYRFLEVNPRFEEQTGLRQPAGKTALELVPNLEPHWVEIYGKVALTGEPLRFEQGSEAMGRWFDVYSFRFGNPSDHKFAIIFNDITARKQAENILQQQRAILEQIINTIPVMISISEPNTEALFLNREFERLIGNANSIIDHVPNGEWREFQVKTKDGGLLDSSWAAILLPDGRQVNIGLDVRERKQNEARNQQLLKLTTALSAALTVDDVIQALEHQGIWLRTMPDDHELEPDSAFVRLPLHYQGQVIGAITFDQSFTEHERSFMLSIAEVCAQALARARLYETEQQARREAEEANRLKTQFLGMISHELRTPLASIKGFITTLLSEDVKFSEDDQRDFLSITNTETDKLTELVEQLLNLARLQAGNLAIDPKPTLFDKILQVAESQLNTLTQNHPFRLEGVETAPLVMADELRIAQVLVNLVGNAVKFSSAGTPITLSIRQREDFVQIDLSDEGIGIPLEARDYIFEVFRQEKHPEIHSKGAGLGLAICKGLIEAHGGKIWVQNRDGKGTTVSFTLPLA